MPIYMINNKTNKFQNSDFIIISYYIIYKSSIYVF